MTYGRGLVVDNTGYTGYTGPCWPIGKFYANTDYIWATYVPTVPIFDVTMRKLKDDALVFCIENQESEEK